MLKIFRNGLAVDTSKIWYIFVEEDEGDELPFAVCAYNVNEKYVVLEWFETQEKADSYVAEVVKEIEKYELD